MQSENELGSLAQAARGNQLKSARWIMIVVGILSIGINGAFLFTADQTIDQEIRDLQSQGLQVADSDVASARLQNRVVFGAGTLLGVVFVILGILVYTFPVPCTMAGLVLYVGSAIVFGVLDPTTLFRGIIIKIFIVVGLAKSVQSAFAYEADSKSQKLASQGSSDELA